MGTKTSSHRVFGLGHSFKSFQLRDLQNTQISASKLGENTKHTVFEEDWETSDWLKLPLNKFRKYRKSNILTRLNFRVSFPYVLSFPLLCQ